MNELTYDKIKNDIEKAKKENAEFIIVFPHWGKEYVLNEIKYQKYFTKIFLDLGVDLVIGTHPHVIQPLKVYYNKESKKKCMFFILSEILLMQLLQEEKIFFGDF